MNETTKYGLIFAGGVLVGALGAVALTRGKLDVKPLATNLLSAGIDLREKLMAGVDGVREDLADVMAEAQVKSQERRMAQEAAAEWMKPMLRNSRKKTALSPLQHRSSRLLFELIGCFPRFVSRRYGRILRSAVL